MKTMRAVAIDEFGGVEKMKPREMPVTHVAADEILIHVGGSAVLRPSRCRSLRRAGIGKAAIST